MRNIQEFHPPSSVLWHSGLAICISKNCHAVRSPHYTIFWLVSAVLRLTHTLLHKGHGQRQRRNRQPRQPAATPHRNSLFLSRDFRSQQPRANAAPRTPSTPSHTCATPAPLPHALPVGPCSATRFFRPISPPVPSAALLRTAAFFRPAPTSAPTFALASAPASAPSAAPTFAPSAAPASARFRAPSRHTFSTNLHCQLTAN
jgi:hypothetical protein